MLWNNTTYCLWTFRRVYTENYYQLQEIIYESGDFLEERWNGRVNVERWKEWILDNNEEITVDQDDNWPVVDGKDIDQLDDRDPEEALDKEEIVLFNVSDKRDRPLWKNWAILYPHQVSDDISDQKSAHDDVHCNHSLKEVHRVDQEEICPDQDGDIPYE